MLFSNVSASYTLDDFYLDRIAGSPERKIRCG